MLQAIFKAFQWKKRHGTYSLTTPRSTPPHHHATLKTCTPLQAHTPLLTTQHMREKEYGNEPSLGFWGDLSQRDSFIEWNKILNVTNEISLIIRDDRIEIILIRQIA